MGMMDWFRPRETRPATAAARVQPLRGLLTPERVALDLALRTRGALLGHAARLLSPEDPRLAAEIREALTDREALGSTALGRGFAVPHARVDALAQPLAAYLATAAPVPFDAPDGRGVAACFVLLVPRDADETHLEMVAGVAERFGDPRFANALRRCSTPDAVVALFDQ